MLTTLNLVLRNKFCRLPPFWNVVLWGFLLKEVFYFCNFEAKEDGVLLLLVMPLGIFSILLFLLSNQDLLCSVFAVHSFTRAFLAKLKTFLFILLGSSLLILKVNLAKSPQQ